MLEKNIIVLFGEAQKGRYNKAYYCESLPQLEQMLGHPPEDSKGLHYAVQALLYQHPLIFFRVEEEGFSQNTYLYGLKLLEESQKMPLISAIAIPGVGDELIIEKTTALCNAYDSIIIISESDLYDYIANR